MMAFWFYFIDTLGACRFKPIHEPIHVLLIVCSLCFPSLALSRRNPQNFSFISVLHVWGAPIRSDVLIHFGKSHRHRTIVKGTETETVGSIES